MTRPKILVVGAGIVGIATALELQRTGFDVTVVSRDDPGTLCSFGAAGNFGGNVHYAVPGLIWQIPRMYLDPNHPFSFDLGSAPALIGWFYRYLKFTRPAEAQKIAQAHAAIGEGVYEWYSAALKEMGVPGLISRSGRLFVWTTKSGFDGDQYGREVRTARRIDFQLLDGPEARDLEPALPSNVYKAVYTPDAGFIRHPFQLTQLLARHLVELGGVIRMGDVVEVRNLESLVEVRTASGDSLTAEQVVLAMGADSGDIAASLGSKVPLVSERGYHVMYRPDAVALSIPVLWEERKIIFTGMSHGFRTSGIAEFHTGKLAPKKRFPKRLDTIGKAFFPQLAGEEMESTWAGDRPATPDYLPVIGRPDPGSRIIFAYGHGHSGYWYAPGTARFVAQIAKREPVSRRDPEPFSPTRFP